MAYIGRQNLGGAYRQLDDISSNFNSSTTAFTMQVNSQNVTLGDVNQIILSLGGVIQKPGTDFTISGSTLTLTTAPAANTNFFAVLLGSDNGGTVTPTDASVTVDKLAIAGGEVKLDADGDTSITADTDDQIDIKIGGADDFAFKANNFEVQSGSTIDMNGQELILDADADTSITADTDDQIDFKVGGNDTHVFDANGHVTLKQFLDATTAGGRITGASNRGNVARINLYQTAGSSDGGEIRLETANSSNTMTEQARVIDGTLMIGCTTATPGVSNTTDGLAINTNGRLFSNAAANSFSQFATDSDGNILSFASAGNGEGVISISGITTTYGGFTGTHWSRLADNSKPTILRGTLMESLDEMCDWYQAVADVAEVKYTAEDEEVKNGSKNVGDVKESAYKKRVPITLPDGKAVGDAVTFTFQGETHTGVYEKETDIKHVKCKISDTADSKKIYGLFSHWDSGFDYLDDDVNDMNIAQVGTFIIRVNKDVTVEAGDLLVSNGDGTAKKQDDDIIRSKTVAKVNSNIKVETYSDGSYTVPCTLHC